MNHSWISLSIFTEKDALRRPLFMLLTFSAVLISIIVPMASAFQFGNMGQRLAADGTMAFQLTFGIILSAYLASATLGDERQKGVAAMLLTKPVSHPCYILTRFAGTASVLLLFSIIMALTGMLAHRIAESPTAAERYMTDSLTGLASLGVLIIAALWGGWRNFRKNHSFHASAIIALLTLLAALCLACGLWTRSGSFSTNYASELDPTIMLRACSLWLALLIFSATAMALGIVLRPVSNAACLILLLMAGMLLPPLAAAAGFPGWQLTALLPDWNRFWIANPNTTMGTAPLESLAVNLIYAIPMIAAPLLLATHFLKSSEIQS